VLPDVIRVKKSRRVRWVGDVARMSERRMHGVFDCETGRTEYVEDVGVDGKVMVMQLIQKRNGRAWAG
jgi:hypothetical protein